MNQEENGQKMPLRILVADDEPAVRCALAETLLEVGHDVVSASRRNEALKTMRERILDLVLLDLMMPDLSGWDVLSEIAASRDLAGLPVVVWSAFDACRDDLPAGGPVLHKPIERTPNPFQVGELTRCVRASCEPPSFASRLSHGRSFPPQAGLRRPSSTAVTRRHAMWRFWCSSWWFSGSWRLSCVGVLFAEPWKMGPTEAQRSLEVTDMTLTLRLTSENSTAS